MPLLAPSHDSHPLRARRARRRGWFAYATMCPHYRRTSCRSGPQHSARGVCGQSEQRPDAKGNGQDFELPCKSAFDFPSQTIAQSPKQISVGSGGGEFKKLSFNFVDQQPVRLHMAFPIAEVVALELVRFASLRKVGFVGQQTDDILQFFKVQVSFCCQLVISLEAIGMDDRFHAGNAKSLALQTTHQPS
jgi:hypothetical protein